MGGVRSSPSFPCMGGGRKWGAGTGKTGMCGACAKRVHDVYTPARGGLDAFWLLIEGAALG